MCMSLKCPEKVLSLQRAGTNSFIAGPGVRGREEGERPHPWDLLGAQPLSPGEGLSRKDTKACLD